MTNKLPTIDIKGKPYVMVKDRIIAFNEAYPLGHIATERLNFNGEVCFKAIAYPDSTNQLRFFTGHSTAYDTSAGIAGQSPVEVAETSAVGRALAMMGIGVIESVASADEIMKPQRTQTAKPSDPMATLCKCGLSAKRVQTKKAGPNFGKWFLTCPKKMGEQCGYFLFEEELNKASNLDLSKGYPKVTPDEYAKLPKADQQALKDYEEEPPVMEYEG